MVDSYLRSQSELDDACSTPAVLCQPLGEEVGRPTRAQKPRASLSLEAHFPDGNETTVLWSSRLKVAKQGFSKARDPMKVHLTVSTVFNVFVGS